MSPRGELRNVLVSWSVPPNHRTDWARVLFTVVDLTDYRRVKSELERAHEQLEQRVGERTAALSQVNTQLRHEIASRLKAESDLRAQEQAFRDLYENAPNVYWSTGADGLIKRVNRQVEGLLGYRPEEVVGKPLMAFVADTANGRDKARVVFERFRQGAATLGEEVEFCAKDGRIVWVNVNVVPVFDAFGAPVMTRSVITDISDRKRTEALLTRRLELERMVASVSKQCAEAQLDNLDAAMNEIVVDLCTLARFDAARIVRSDSQSCWATPNANAHGDLWDRRDHEACIRVPVRHAGTQLGELQLALSHANATETGDGDTAMLKLLADSIGATLFRIETERELIRARELAESGSQAKSDFLASMSHELRTPLNVILGYAQLLERDPRIESDTRGNLRTMRRSGEHLLTLIDDVLQLARVEAGRVDLQPRAVNLSTMLGELGEMFRIRAADARIRFALDLPASLPAKVLLDDRRLRQVLLNLLGNALKYSRVGTTVTLRLSSSVSAGTQTLCFEVIDQGVGISADEVDRIFEPFYQLERSDGVGLGLAISRKLVAAMGGSITVESQVGEGSTFRVAIEVPVVDAVAEETQASLVATGYEGARRRVLVVDDHSENRLVLRRLLESLGFEVDELDGGIAALDWIERRPAPDLVFIDLVMPDMDGFETVRRLRSRAAGSALKVVAVSASAFETERRQSIVSGCDDFLVKPLQVDQVIECLGRLLALRWTGTSATPLAEGVAGALPESLRSALRELVALGDVGGIRTLIDAQELASPGDAALQRLRAMLDRFDLRALAAEVAA
ncbi:MAG: response regulator [Gammaproteobacteria bacterium]|nr:response regulator [Gammaproteobacteria bacterium]